MDTFCATSDILRPLGDYSRVLPRQFSGKFPTVPHLGSAPSPTRQIIHGHDRHELTWVCEGSAWIEIAGMRWHLRPEQALWIPARIEHVVDSHAGALIFPLFFDTTTFDTPWARPTLVRRTPRLDQLARVLLQQGLYSPEDVAAARDSMIKLIPKHAQSSAMPPLPLDPRARAVADRIVQSPALPFTLEEWAERVHTSSKTLQRYFVNETHMRFPEWRCAVRLTAALALLERGDQVTHVAAQVGYHNVSSFIAAFRKRYGYTPARHRAPQAA